MAEDYSHIVSLEYGSTKYDWSLLENSKFVLECTYKEGVFKRTKQFVRMYDAGIIELPNGLVQPKRVVDKLLLKGVIPNSIEIPFDNLVKTVYHFRSAKPFDTEQFIKEIVQGEKA